MKKIISCLLLFVLVFGICSCAQTEQPESFDMDIDDLYGTAWQGLHSGCAAGAYVCMLRGVLGVRMKEDAIYLAPAKMPFWNKVSMNFCYRGVRIYAEYTQQGVVLSVKEPACVHVMYNGTAYELKDKLVLSV